MGGSTVAVGPGMVSPQQAMFIQQQARAFAQQGPGGVLQGPLAYLEKTTSNIGNNNPKNNHDVNIFFKGITDGRR